LCDAVTITPASAPSCLMEYASTGVGSGRGRTIARNPAPVTTAAVSSANTSDLRLASYPMTTRGTP
jgi:hypothetical protein